MTDAQPFASLEGTPGNHFRLHFYAAVSDVLAAASQSGSEPVTECLKALRGYDDELRASGVPDAQAADVLEWWCDAITQWEATVTGFLPLRAVRRAIGVDVNDMVLAFTSGLIEEDARFSALFERMNGVHGQSGQPRATIAMLTDCRRGGQRPDWRRGFRQFVECGMLRVINADAPRVQHGIEVAPALWDVFRGEFHQKPESWLRYAPPDQLPAWNDLILDRSCAQTLTSVPRLIAAGEARTIVLRGPQHNGRRTVLSAIARAAGRGILDASAVNRPDNRIDEERWRHVALLATAMHAMPVLTCEVAPGERLQIPRPEWFDGPVGIAVGRSGGIGGSASERAITFTLGMPAPATRRACWRKALCSDGGSHGNIDAIAESFRLPSGHIMRAATLARGHAALAGRSVPSLDDIRDAARFLNAQALDPLASRVPCAGDWNDLAAREDTMRELLDLELRCRQRERLPSALDRGGGSDTSAVCGVRALFRGPSGTGKTLAARVLGSVLQKDLYRVDLSAIVNKYIGETEKNLDRVIARAEELDVILLFDEGDALLTQRTGVSSANDRYANLETNFLLQRLEVFDGILIITTNANERIDTAFERRMDVVVEFLPAQPAERWALWQLHLPPNHSVAADFIDELASRCALNGGQVHNAVQHAVLEALSHRGVVDAALLEAAVRREYRKTGAVCPLRSGVPVYSD
jgi:hypothetical protein